MVMRRVGVWGVCYSCFLFLILFIFCCCCYLSTTQNLFDSLATANLSTTWSVNNSSIQPGDGSTIISSYNFQCGFVCTGNCTSYLFSVSITPYYEASQVVWSANRDHLVSDDAELSLTASGDLVLRDVDGSTVWSTNTTGKSVAGLKLNQDGNLVLFDTNNSVVWQSFDYPTDSLLPGQTLFIGQQLIPSVSTTDLTPQSGLFSLRAQEYGLFAYAGSNPPLPYASIDRLTDNRVRFWNGGWYFYNLSEVSYMKLMPDGHLQVFVCVEEQWTVMADLLKPILGDCGYPMACGRNSLCYGNRVCSCLVPEYFRAVNDRQPDLGCYETTPLTCNSTQHQELILLEDVTYFITYQGMRGVDTETCKKACLNNCSCKAALFNYYPDISDGFCYLASELLTTIRIEGEKFSYVNGSALIKVHKSRPDPIASRIILISTCSGVAFLFGVVGSTIYIIRRRRQNAEIKEKYAEMEEESIGNIQGMPTRFTYETLKAATKNFNKKLGEGGFGAVFEGTLEDGSKIAVKCLEGLGQVKKSFLAEVQSIGRIHHVNLVRLRGFCVWKSQHLLVYEFMSNGSLDRWIYHGVRERVLEWKCKKKIILDVAKGLAYLHEDCRQKIIHLDIKPQNILLDDEFNAKVSDFGLSKLIDRNQSKVKITLRGTPGYMAPEWLSSVINEKVDVYGFGIILLETLSGRKKFDKSCPKESQHLLDVFQKCWERGTLLDLVDKDSEVRQSHSSDFMEMMKIAAWCLQYDFTKTPSMSKVIKVLEGMLNVESSLSYNFTYPSWPNTLPSQSKDMTQLQTSILSGPR